MGEHGPLLDIHNITAEYTTSAGPVPAVVDFSLTLERGESYGLVGESGCGKTTVAMAIMGYLGANGRVSRGKILLEGRNLVGRSEADLKHIRGTRIAMVYQEPMSALNPTLTVGRQLMEVPMTHRGASRREARERALKVLADVHMPDPAAILGRYPHQLSGGQQQRVVIAMALLANPSLLLLDEPTTGLDVTVEASVTDLIGELREKYQTSLLYISHNLGLIAKVCDRLGVMYSGQLVEQGRVADVFGAARHPYTLGLLSCIPRLGTDKRVIALHPIRGQVSPPTERPPGCFYGPRCDYFQAGLCDRGPIPLEEVGASHLARCTRWREVVRAPIGVEAAVEGAEDERTVLEVEKLTKLYDDRSALLLSLLGRSRSRRVKANEDLNFLARRGEILAIVGESGCGKSTFAKVLTGLEAASEGEIRFEGQGIAHIPVRQRSRRLIRAIQMVFQNPEGTLNPSHSVGWAIARAVRTLRGCTTGQSVGERVRELLELVRLPSEFRDRRPRQLSGGQKQRVAIARAFAGRPSLVVADEPVSALDVSVQAAIINLLLQVQARHRTTMVFISHDLSLVRYLADHIVVMYLGRVMEYGPAEAIFEPPYHPYTEALLSAVPVPNADVHQKRIRLAGEPPSPINLPRGCRFASRCPRKVGPICDSEMPPLRWAGPDHWIACHISVEELRRVESIFTPRVTSARTEATVGSSSRSPSAPSGPLVG